MGRPPFGFESVEHTADVAIRGWGRNLEELFAAMARGLFDVIADVASVRRLRERTVEITAATVEDRLHDWLETLNTLHQVHHELYGDFTVAVDPEAVRAIVRGEPVDAQRHDLRTEVKAVTWHDLSVRRTDGGYEAYVLLDI